MMTYTPYAAAGWLPRHPATKLIRCEFNGWSHHLTARRMTRREEEAARQWASKDKLRRRPLRRHPVLTAHAGNSLDRGGASPAVLPARPPMSWRLRQRLSRGSADEDTGGRRNLAVRRRKRGGGLVGVQTARVRDHPQLGTREVLLLHPELRPGTAERGPVRGHTGDGHDPRLPGRQPDHQRLGSRP